jgi:hypothetical protein
MKKLLAGIALTFLAGCSFIMPIPHDAVMFGDLVDVKLSVEKLSCSDKDWKTTMTKVERLKVYASLRKDPQAEAVANLEDALKKANTSSNEKFCEGVLKLQKTRVEVIANAWRGR